MRSENAVSRGFILPDGTIAKSGTQHDDIAMEYICEHKLNSKYDESRFKDLSDFMVYEMGAIKVGCNGGYNQKVITFRVTHITREQWIYVEYYESQGYKLDML